jgi:acetyl-CoA synthetase-like protein
LTMRTYNQRGAVVAAGGVANERAKTMSDVDLVNPLVKRWLQDAREHPDDFWAEAAGQLHWFKKWERVFA